MCQRRMPITFRRKSGLKIPRQIWYTANHMDVKRNYTNKLHINNVDLETEIKVLGMV